MRKIIILIIIVCLLQQGCAVLTPALVVISTGVKIIELFQGDDNEPMDNIISPTTN